MEEFDGDNDKLLAKFQQHIESDQLGEFRREFKGPVSDSLQVRLVAERECCGIALSVDNCGYERMSEQIAHSSVAQNEVCGGTQLTRVKTANLGNGGRRVEPVLLVALGELRRTNQVLGSKRHSA